MKAEYNWLLVDGDDKANLSLNLNSKKSGFKFLSQKVTDILNNGLDMLIERYRIGCLSELRLQARRGCQDLFCLR